MLMLVFGAVVVVTILFYHYFVKPLRYWKDRGIEQGDPKLIFGHFWENILGKSNGTDIFQKVYDQSPKARYTGMYRFSTPVLLPRDPDFIKQITVKYFDHFSDHSEMVPAETDPLWAKTLLSLTGSQWREMRAHLSPSFTSSKMRGLFLLMTECAETLLQHLLQEDQEVVTVEIRDIFSRYTNDVIATTVFGVKVDSLADPKNYFYQMGKEVSNIGSFWKTLKLLAYWLIPGITNFIKVQLITDETGGFFRQIVEETIKAREEKGIVRPDMLHLLLQARKDIQRQEQKITDGKGNTSESLLEITNDDITANAIIFFIGGLESVSSSISFTVYELAINPDVQEKLRKEVHATLEKCGGNVTYEAIFDMKYMDMVVSESMRKWPHFTGLNRTCTKPYTIEPLTPDEKPIFLEKGAEIIIPVFSIQHDPKYFPDPERFDPERFNDENKHNINPYAYFPFGLGPRNCIGSRFTIQEVKIVLFYLLSRLDIVPVEKTAIPLKFSKTTLIDLRPIDGLWIGFKRCVK